MDALFVQADAKLGLKALQEQLQQANYKTEYTDAELQD